MDMVRLGGFGIVGVAAVIYLAGAAFAERGVARAALASSCELKGNWRDQGGYNFAFTTNRAGTWGWQPNVPGYAGCPAPWTISVTKRGASKFHALFQDTNTNGCGQSFSVTMQFSAGCNGATGRYVNALAGMGQEVWTRLE
jgi:hypothetical protein